MIVFSHTHKNVLETLFCVLTVSSHVLYMSRGLHSGSMNSTWKVFECLPPVQQYYTTVWFSSIFFDGHAVKDPYHTYVYSSSWRDRIILHSYLDHFLSSNKVKNKSKNNPFIIGLEASRLHVKAFISKAGAFCGEAVRPGFILASECEQYLKAGCQRSTLPGLCTVVRQLSSQ